MIWRSGARAFKLNVEFAKPARSFWHLHRDVLTLQLSGIPDFELRIWKRFQKSEYRGGWPKKVRNALELLLDDQKLLFLEEVTTLRVHFDIFTKPVLDPQNLEVRPGPDIKDFEIRSQERSQKSGISRVWIQKSGMYCNSPHNLGSVGQNFGSLGIYIQR